MTFYWTQLLLNCLSGFYFYGILILVTDWFYKMPKASSLECYFGCVLDGPLHRFPKWEYSHEERFNQWKSILTPTTQEKGNNYIYNSIRICYRHFEAKYRLPSRRLTLNAIPTLNTRLEQHLAEDVMSSTSSILEPVQYRITDDSQQILIDDLDTRDSMTPAIQQSHLGALTPQVQPALYGQTKHHGEMVSQHQPSPNTQKRVRRKRHLDQTAKYFKRSDKEWRAIRMQQHQEYMEMKREENRIRLLELQKQREWHSVAMKALDFVEKVVNKFCKD